MSTEALIQLDHVTKRFGAVVAVNAVSLHADAGDLIVLLGRSGCGKTTLLRLIAGLERADAGAITLAGQQVSGDNVWVAPEKRRLGMVFQDYALFPHLSAADNIAFALSGMPRAQQRTRIGDMLDLVGLHGVDQRYPHQLSGGQQQRVALARALASDPPVVLLDEPFSNLDAALRATMREDVRRILQTAGATAVFVTHDQEEALRLADRLVIMLDGRIIQQGTPDEVYRFPNSRAAADFLGDSVLLSGTVIDGAVVETRIGRLPLARPAEGGAVTVMLRPEALKLIHNPDGNARVIGVRYYGFHRLVDLVYADDLPLTARVWSHETLTIGDRVDVAVVGAVAVLTD